MGQLLFDEDYEYLKSVGLDYDEDSENRLLILRNFPLSVGLYTYKEVPITTVEVLVVIPLNYNMDGGDMFWTHPFLTRADGVSIPNIMTFGGGDPRFFGGKEYCRWSRHFIPGSWKPKVDKVSKILDRIEWALKNPST